jgi:hypothetical protein
MEENDLKNAMVKWILTSKPTYYIVICWNSPLSLFSAKQKAGKFLQRIDRIFLGPKYLKNPELRANGFVTIEHLASNCHANCILSFPETGGRDVISTVKQALISLPMYGSYDVQPIFDLPGIADYITKEGNPDALFHTAEFHPEK